ncbi:hypothetical protein ACFX19_041111 [Malus domestica]
MAQNIQLPSKAKWAHPPKHQLSTNVGSLRTRSSSNEFTEEDDVVKVSSCNEIESDRVHTIETSNESIEEDDVIEATSAATEAESYGVHAVQNNGTNMENTMNVEEYGRQSGFPVIFDNADQVVTYYKKYGRQSGFPVIKRSSTKGDDGKLRYITMCCARSGTSKSTSSNRLKSYPSIKNDCKAQLRACLYLGEKWRVNYVKLDHNHGLSPTKTHYWKCFLEVSSSVKKKLEVNDKARIRVNKSYN